MREPGIVLLHAVGDISLGDHPLCTGFGTHSRSRREAPGFAFRHVADVLSRADLRFGNLECTLSEQGIQQHAYHSVQMRGHAAYVKGLIDTDFHVLNVANNHSMQHGREPFEDTLQMLRRAGIAVCGVRDGNASRPVTTRVNGLRITFIGYSLRPRQYFTEEPLYAEGRADDMVRDVRAARRDCDVLVVSAHWGDEFIDRPSPSEVELAHALVEAGADLVIGHHPHVLRGIERHGRGWIVYSLGNFVCDMRWGEELRETAICECRLTSAGVEDVRFIPARINDDCQPVPLHGADADRLTRRIAQLSATLGVASNGSADYERDAEAVLTATRARSQRYFLRNLYRFPPRILAAQVLTYARNRMAERGWLAGATR